MPKDENSEESRKNAIVNNIARADIVARSLSSRGHFPFVPHTTLRGWEDEHKVPREVVTGISDAWLKKCDALYFIDDSPGAEAERKLAAELGLPIYRHLDDVPRAQAITGSSPEQPLPPEAFQAYLIEYEQCMESYRHTYATVWQASALFAAISGAIVAFGGQLGPVANVVAPLPILFWYLGIFRPMNRYGEARNDRLAELEGILSKTPGLDMQHFRRFSRSRKSESELKRILKFKWLWRPRVIEVVTIFGVGLLVLQLYLLVRTLFS